MDFLTSEIKKQIKRELKPLTDSNITTVETAYKKIIEKIPYQYLAHLIRTMEMYAQEKLSCPFFRITCSPVDIREVAQGLASGLYYDKTSFDIVYDSKSDAIQTRVAIAHELGHLFVILLNNGQNAEDKHEPLSSLFGITAMIHKRIDNNGKKRCHKSDEDIVKDFILLKNKDCGTYNKSC